MTAPLDDVAAATVAATGAVSVPLGDKTVRVLPLMDWRQSAMAAIKAQDYNAWAQLVLVNDRAEAEDGTITGSDDAQVWRDTDPTNRQLVDFLAAYADASGTALGK